MKTYSNEKNYLFFWGHQENEGEITKACLSQWYPCKFWVDGQYYTSAEQYMMAEKARIFDDKEIRAKILAEDDPRIIQALGRQVRNFDAKVWDILSIEVVRIGNVCKFGQNMRLQQFLLNTGYRTLVEASPYDEIWGIGMSEEEALKTDHHLWRGSNRLGRILTDVRQILRKTNEL